MISLEHLNPPQREAVLHADGPLVVFAGAGSGKTRVITHRVAHMVGDLGVEPWRILAVTFTNKAAAEMRERLAEMVPGGIQGLAVGTFHSTCARLLRRHHDQTGVREDFTIYDQQDQQAMVKRVVKDLKLDPERFGDKIIANRIGAAKQEMRGPDEVDAGDPWSRGVAQIYGAYEEAMQRSGALDFGDLIYRMVRAIEANEELRLHLSRRYRYIMVDEFQDTNHSQLRLVRALASAHRNLCVVGDDDQSIYKWRGADRRNILDFRRDFPDAKIIKLEQNYRSTKRILRAAHGVIRNNIDREPKELWTDNAEGEPVLAVQTVDEREEARLIVRGVAELLATGRDLDDIAVLYRIHAQSRILEESLRAENLPYRIVGGMRFYDRAEVKDILAYLKVAQNPDDDVSLLRILNKPARGIGKTTVERLLDAALAGGGGVWQALNEAGENDVFKAGTRKKLARFVTLIEELRELVAPAPEDAEPDSQLDLLSAPSSGQETTIHLAQLGREALDRSGYRGMLEKEDSAEADARLQNIGELISSMEQFEDERLRTGEAVNLAAFLEQVSLQSQEEETVAGQKLTLMTVHAAKGLEFGVVMAAGLEEGLFPFKAGGPGESPDELEEERRLAYVAFTRAKERLILSHAGRRMLFGRIQYQTPSRFLAEIPADAVQHIGRGQNSAPARSSRGRGWDPDPYAGTDEWAPPARPSRSRSVVEPGESYVDTSEGDFEGVAITEGMRVRHGKYGVGRVAGVTPGDPPKVTVRFEGHPEKRILATFLEPA